jgi:hypothetical protein
LTSKKWYRPEIDVKLQPKIKSAALSEGKESRQWLSELLYDYFSKGAM